MADFMESFWLYGEDGSMHRAHISQDRIDTTSLESPTPGLKTARLQDGTHLELVDENTFRNAVTGELLSRKAKEPKKTV